MASPKPPQQEAIVCVRVPCREGKERVWQAIELLRHAQQLLQQSQHPVPPHAPSYPRGPAASQPGLKRTALYARVSTEKQEREETVARQVDLLYQAAAASGYDIAPTSVFIDEGVSGARLDRPALDRLRDLAVEGAFEVLLVTGPDRLARRYAYQVLLVEEFTRCGCEVVFVQHGLGASPEEQMLLQMQGVFAEYERALIQERTRRGRLFAARQGRVNWGNPPYGYTYVRKTSTAPQHLVINEAEAEVVRLIYRWCVRRAVQFLHHPAAAHSTGDRSPQGAPGALGPE